MTAKNIERLLNTIHRSLAMTTGRLSYDRVTDAIIKLADTLTATDTDEFIWGLGEGLSFNLGDLIAGAFWHYAQWHAGQDSKGYAALSALGNIYSPGMEDGPEPETGEETAFDLLEQAATFDGMPVYDNGEETADRYTVFPFYRSENEADRCQYLGLSEGGRAVSMWGEVDYFDPEGMEYLGEKVPFSALSHDTKNHIIRRVNA